MALTQRDDGSLAILLLNNAFEILLGFSLLSYCGFAALHATQHLADPVERSWWLVITLGLNVAGSLFYYLTKHHAFTKIGAGGLLGYDHRRSKSLTKLSAMERSGKGPQPKLV